MIPSRWLHVLAAKALAPMILLVSAVIAASALSVSNEQTSHKSIAVVANAPKVDGTIHDLSGATTIAPVRSAKGHSSAIGIKVAQFETDLWIGVTIEDDRVTDPDTVDLTLFFPGSGLTAQGLVVPLNHQGWRPSEFGPSAHSKRLIAIGTAQTAKGFTAKVKIPARALPRFQARGDLLVSICADYRDFDDPHSDLENITTCPSGDMPSGPLKMSDRIRRNLGSTFPKTIEGIESNAFGWMGVTSNSSVSWVLADETLTKTSLARLVSERAPTEFASVHLPEPPRLVLPDGRLLLPFLSGRNPYDASNACNNAAELKLALFAVTGKTAVRVFEWPVSNCTLGRAMRIELGPEGNLSLAYTQGATLFFTWSDGQFERSELGLHIQFPHGVKKS